MNPRCFSIYCFTFDSINNKHFWAELPFPFPDVFFHLRIFEPTVSLNWQNFLKVFKHSFRCSYSRIYNFPWLCGQQNCLSWPCNHCRNWTWVVKEILAYGDRLRSTHCRDNYKNTCRYWPKPKLLLKRELRRRRREEFRWR